MSGAKIFRTHMCPGTTVATTQLYTFHPCYYLHMVWYTYTSIAVPMAYAIHCDVDPSRNMNQSVSKMCTITGVRPMYIPLSSRPG